MVQNYALKPGKTTEACAENNVTTVEGLLKKPQSPDSCDMDGWPALHTAAAAGHEEFPID